MRVRQVADLLTLVFCLLMCGVAASFFTVAVYNRYEEARDTGVQRNTESISKIEKLLNLHGYYLHEVE